MIVWAIVLMIAHTATTSRIVYSVNENYEIINKVSSDQLAHAIFEDQDKKIGWNKLYINANPNANPVDQHQAAGFLEGYATYQQIYSAFINFMALDFNRAETVPPKIQSFLDQQIDYVQYMVGAHQNDPFWQYTGYYMQQVRYMFYGYQARVKKQSRTQDRTLTFRQFFYLTSVGDLQDLIPWSQQNLQTKESQFRKNCNAYIKLTNQQLYITHGTHNRYSFLLRIYKSWSFPRKGVATQRLTFTSRPGDLISKDDFWLLDSGLSVLQTSLENKNKENWKQIKVNTVPSWLRTLVANHLSSSISEWIQYFNTQRSGTHNNQWIIIDTKRVKQRQQMIYFLDEAFSDTSAVDMTPILLRDGYVGSYNMPISQRIYTKLGYDHQKNWDYWSDPRAVILKRYHPYMNSIQDMKKYLVMNEQSNVTAGLAPRYDKFQENPRAFGMTDCKIASLNTIKNNYFWAISGPPVSNGRFPPFDWSKFSDPVYHIGLPTKYDFNWQQLLIKNS